jgi:hypothetical protein
VDSNVDETDSFSELLKKAKDNRLESTRILAEYKGQIETLRGLPKHDQLTDSIISVFALVIDEIDERIAHEVEMFDLVLPIISEQEKEIKGLESILANLVTGNIEVSEKLVTMEKWRKKRERMLHQIEDYADERRRFLNEKR